LCRKAGQAQRRVGRDGAALAHNLVDARGRHPEFQRQPVRAHLERDKKLFAQHFPRMNGAHFIGRIHYASSSVTCAIFHTHEDGANRVTAIARWILTLR